MIKLTLSLLKTVTHSAKKSYPMESCGLLVGHKTQNKEFTITRILECQNISEYDKRCNFLIDPKAYFELKRELDWDQRFTKRKEKILGHFHSHPDQPPKPSLADKKMVGQIDLVWLIVGINNRNHCIPEAHMFNLKIGDFEELPITII